MTYWNDCSHHSINQGSNPGEDYDRHRHHATGTCLALQRRQENRAHRRAHTPVEFQEVHVQIARNIPLDRLDVAAFMQTHNGSANEPLYVICRSGSRGQQTCEKFLKAGFTNVVNVEGGTMACVEAGLQVVRGKKAVSLERQVRIAAGSLVLLGAALAWFVDPAFIGLSAFVGAGLVFARVSDTCGMGMVLARMPWNQCGKDSMSCCVR